MKASNAKPNSLYLNQLFFVTINIQIGFAALRISYITGQKAGHDGWLSVIAAGVVTQLLILLIWLLMRQYPRQDLFQIAVKLLGRLGGKLAIVLCAFYFCLLVQYTLVEITRLIHVWVLPLTPQWALLLFPVLCIGYVAVEPARVLARFLTLSSLLLLFPLVLGFIPMVQGHWLYLLPVGDAGFVPIMKGAKEAFFGFLGFESIFVTYALSRGTAAQKLGVISTANATVMLYYVYLAIAGTVAFSPEESKLVPEPVLYMLKAVSFKIAERPDLLFFSVWLIIILATSAGYLFLASSAIHRLSGLKRKLVIIAICLACYLIALFATGQDVMKLLRKMLEYTSFVVLAGIPALLLIVAGFRKRTEVHSYE